MTVGSGDLQFEPVPDWLDLPDGPDLIEAVGVACDSNDRVFVFNRGRLPITIVDRDGRFLDGWGEGLFVRPHGIWIAADDTLYLVDDMGHSVRQFTPDGELLQTIGPAGDPSDTGVEGFDYRTIRAGGPPFNLPTNLVTSSSGEMFVTDGYGNARVHRFSKDGELLNSWGEPGDGSGQFNVPHGLGIDSDDRLYVADRENSRVVICDTGGTRLEEWTDVIRPTEVFVTSDDLVYVSELGRWTGLFPWFSREDSAPGGRLSIFTRDGELLARWGGGQNSEALDQFYAPHDVWVDTRGDLYVGEVKDSAARLVGDDTRALPPLRKFVRVRSEN